MIQWVGVLFALLVMVSFAVSLAIKQYVETKWPAIGEFADIDGTRVHYVDVPGGEGTKVPPILFIHGSNGNLRDQMASLRPLLEGQARLIFVDRPGHGYSTRKGKEYSDPTLQAGVIAGLLAHLGIERAIISGHSVGAASAVAFGVHFPGQTAGLLFLAPATHPWPSGVDWYYKLANRPIIGAFFSYVFAPAIGWLKYKGGVTSVFAPNPLPDDYEEKSGTRLALRGRVFLNNSLDVANLNYYVTRLSPRYHEITAPAVIITGDSDDVVRADIHSEGLARDIAGAKLVSVRNLGHKPDYIALQEIAEAIKWIAARAN